ncbi:cobalt ECF transporter T component CbiQ [Methanococcoides burtonii]|uniref:Cobalt ABC transporter permease protein n=1 Tax=Methanococcoides burtonii (strain DSM 6242 / NBRC 107633 / OCM 468 / ACE-M) TaxID=259564 RepID=Q12VD4_METBU|nr:cobalt ECF transporter T component CbiQ [Methanococcoides burtonii]ABE52592.1 Cobalt ABC transporter permease protein [Methanococcoides burtonii DSM 6242]
MTNILDDYALVSPLRYRNNWLKIAIVGFGVLVGVSSQSFIPPFAIALCMSFTTVYFGKTSLKFYLTILSAPAVFVLLSVIIIAFFFGSGTEIFGFNIFNYHLGVNTGGLDMALLVFSRTLSGMSCLFFLALTTPMVELFSVLKATKLPDSFIEISMMMYRYIFVFLEVAWGIKYAQTVRLGYKDWRTALNSLAMLSTTLFIRSWEQGEKIFISMSARCYDGKLIFFEEKRPIRANELVLTCTYFAVVLVLWYLTRINSIF